MGYTKLFTEILDSTIWSEPNETRLVWITMLAMSDKNGFVAASEPGLAHRAHIALEECLAALETLSSPDPYSRSKVKDGIRIEKVDGGWNLVNHAKYRDMLNAEERRKYNRRKQQEYREKDREKNVKQCQTMSANVKESEHCQHIATATASTDTDTEGTSSSAPTLISKSERERVPMGGSGGEGRVLTAVEQTEPLEHSLSNGIELERVCSEILTVYPKNSRKSECMVALAESFKHTPPEEVLRKVRGIAEVLALNPRKQKCYAPSAIEFFEAERWQEDPQNFNFGQSDF